MIHGRGKLLNLLYKLSARYIIFASDREGLGKDAAIFSFHKNYSKYADFMGDYGVCFSDFVNDVQSFIVSLKTGLMMKPFDLAYWLMTSNIVFDSRMVNYPPF